MFRYPKIGFVLEIFGFINLFAYSHMVLKMFLIIFFSDLFPLFIQLAYNVPILKDILESPMVAKVIFRKNYIILDN